METLNEAIMNRISIRSYIDKPIAKVQKKQIQRFLNSNPTGPFGNSVRFRLVDVDELSTLEMYKLATYGVINGARLYIMGTVRPARYSLEDFGYCMENVILKATKLGFGTCWVTSNFTRDTFGQKNSSCGGEIVPCISPLGYFQHKRSLSIQIMKLIANSRERRQWGELFFQGSFDVPLEKEFAGDYQVPLEAVRVGPSASNREPWRVVMEKTASVFHFYLNRCPALCQEQGPYNAENVDIGIAMCHFELSAGELGFTGSWKHLGRNGCMPGTEYIISWIAD